MFSSSALSVTFWGHYVSILQLLVDNASLSPVCGRNALAYSSTISRSCGIWKRCRESRISGQRKFAVWVPYVFNETNKVQVRKYGEFLHTFNRKSNNPGVSVEWQLQSKQQLQQEQIWLKTTGVISTRVKRPRRFEYLTCLLLALLNNKLRSSQPQS